MYKDNLARKMVVDTDVKQEPHTLVIPGCSSLHEFLRRNMPAQQPVQGGQGDEFKEGEVLVIRGFDNLLHYLDWLDAQACLASGYNRSESEN
jgi:hypothetical protein